MLLAFAMEGSEAQPFKHAHFSVVKHPGNTFLDKTLDEYTDLIGHNPRFSSFTSADVIAAAGVGS